MFEEKEESKSKRRLTKWEISRIKEAYDGTVKSIYLLADEIDVCVSTIYYWTNHNGYRDKVKKRSKKHTKDKNKTKIKSKASMFIKWLIERNLLSIDGDDGILIELLEDKFNSM